MQIHRSSYRARQTWTSACCVRRLFSASSSGLLVAIASCQFYRPFACSLHTAAAPQAFWLPVRGGRGGIGHQRFDADRGTVHARDTFRPPRCALQRIEALFIDKFLCRHLLALKERLSADLCGCPGREHATGERLAPPSSPHRSGSPHHSSLDHGGVRPHRKRAHDDMMSEPCQADSGAGHRTTGNTRLT